MEVGQEWKSRNFLWRNNKIKTELWYKKPVIERNDLLKDEQHQMLISKAYKEAYDSETDNSETEDNKKQKEENEGNPERKRRKDEGEEEAELPYDLTSLRDDKQLNLIP